MTTSFADRHIGPSASQAADMVELLGYPDLDALMDAAVPQRIRNRDSMHLPAALSEEEAAAKLRAMAMERIASEGDGR